MYSYSLNTSFIVNAFSMLSEICFEKNGIRKVSYEFVLSYCKNYGSSERFILDFVQKSVCLNENKLCDALAM